jgi:hypothetical protein
MPIYDNSRNFVLQNIGGCARPDLRQITHLAKIRWRHPIYFKMQPYWNGQAAASAHDAKARAMPDPYDLSIHN